MGIPSYSYMLMGKPQSRAMTSSVSLLLLPRLADSPAFLAEIGDFAL